MAAAAGLIYVSDSDPGIRRVGKATPSLRRPTIGR